MKSRVYVVFLLLVGSVAAQLDTGSVLGRVRVRVDFVNGVCDLSTHVTLMGRSGPVAEGVANEQCEVEFVNIPAGTYHLNVSGRNLADTDNVITPSAGSTDFEVKIRRANDADRAGGAPGGPSVSAVELAIPLRAQKEFDRANELIGKQEFSKAIQSLNRAIAIYPAYAGAYNNLGVIYARLGDRAQEREALQKALSINDHFAPAYVNVGRLNIAAGDFSGAETALNRAAAFDPTDAMTLVLLTYTEFMSRHIDQAIATSRKAHTLPGSHAFAHQVAARAFEQKRDGANAIAELEQFLKEEPEGSRADVARKELAALQAIPN
jgi:tetratricopeptide (TPR) repeat protein